MKSKQFVLISLLIFLCTVPSYSFFFTWGADKVEIVKDLPNTDAYYLPNIEGHADAGYRFKQFSILFCPVVNYDKSWCLYNEESEKYVDLTEAKLKEITPLPSENPLSFWDRIGGKLAIAVLLIIGYFYFMGTKETPETRELEEEVKTIEEE